MASRSWRPGGCRSILSPATFWGWSIVALALWGVEGGAGSLTVEVWDCCQLQTLVLTLPPPAAVSPSEQLSAERSPCRLQPLQSVQPAGVTHQMPISHAPHQLRTTESVPTDECSSHNVQDNKHDPEEDPSIHFLQLDPHSGHAGAGVS